MKKTVVITGAAGNLGRAAVAKFVNEGWDVITIVSPGKAAQGPVGPGITTFEADLVDETEVSEVLNIRMKETGKVDAALLLAGGYASGTIQSTDEATIRKMMEVNFETAYNVARPLFTKMIAQPEGARIVLVGARPALSPSDGKKSIAYALSKSLLFRLAEFLNAEGSTHNVITSVIVPSTIDTPQNRAAMPKADFSKWVSPEQLAGILFFIASDQSAGLREPVYKVYGDS